MPERHFMPPTNGTEERLDAVLDELGELRAELQGIRAHLEPAKPDDGSVELREPKGRRKR